MRVSSVSTSYLPTLEVEMQSKVSQGWCKAIAIADTEEKVCVVGLQHLCSLSLIKEQLREAFVGLVDIADPKLKVTGCALCDVRLGDAVTQQHVCASFIHHQFCSYP